MFSKQQESSKSIEKEKKNKRKEREDGTMTNIKERALVFSFTNFRHIKNQLK